jgi:hypothetical protein
MGCVAGAFALAVDYGWASTRHGFMMTAIIE